MRTMQLAGTLICSLSLLAVCAAPPTLAQDEKDRTQTRPAKVMVEVPVEIVEVDDGDTVRLHWASEEAEIIRILGIDTPETQHVEHNIPYDQSFGREAAGFAKGAFSTATSVQLIRADMTDPYGRTLGYLYVNGKNYSVLVVSHRLAVESVSHYGDNGLPEAAKEVLDAAATAGPVPFEAPYKFRGRMRDVSQHMREGGTE